MANTIINIPFLQGDLAYTVDVLNAADLSVLQAGIALSIVSGQHQGTVTGNHAGKLIFAIKHNAILVESRIRTIADDAGPYLIITGLDAAVVDESGQPTSGAVLPQNPSDSDLLSTGYAIVYDSAGNREDGVDVTIQLTSGPGVAGFGLHTASRTQTSATVTINGESVVGYVEFPGMRRGGIYTVKSGGLAVATQGFGSRTVGSPSSFVVPDAPSFALNEFLWN